MNELKVAQFKELFEQFKQTKEYKKRAHQFLVVPFLKEIIEETLKNPTGLTSQQLTGLIQMLRYDCSEDNFLKYVAVNIADINKRNEFIKRADNYDEGEWGYTNVGKTGIKNLSDTQLKIVKKFLIDAFKVTTVEEGVSLCDKYDNEEIPEVKSGVYSPWLYYIIPSLFPIINTTHINFLTWLEIDKKYSECIKAFDHLKDKVDESELGMIDAFAHRFIIDTAKRDIDKLLEKLHELFPHIWRCATSNKWDAFKDRKVLSLEWLDAGEDYKNISDFGKGKMSISRWVKSLKEGDLIVVMDKYKYYGIAIAKSAYEFDENIENIDGEFWSTIKVEFIHELEIPINHNLGISHTNPATFFELEGVGFNERATFKFIEKTFPEVLIKLENYISTSKPLGGAIDKINSPKNNYMNSILYGPPGTGKTFHSISHSVAIVENKNIESIILEERELVKNRFDQYIKDGQIVFSTFHQSLSYEDFIEGIKPIEPSSEDEELTYAVEDGIFKRLCTEAAFSFVQKNTTTETEKVLDFSTEYDRFVDMVNERFSKGDKTELETRSGGNVYIESISQKNNIWVRHIDGNRTYTVSKKRLSKISQAFPELSEVTNINDQFRVEIGGSNSSAYWAVLNAIRKQPAATSKETKTISEKEYSYDDKKEIIESLKNDDYKIENPKKFVLIIDEINRGNVSQIFGELITLIEDDKRLGKDEALRATLPYSKECFGVPCNLSIIGTMNTADRSVEALDTALRRRFAFVHTIPDPAKLEPTKDGINLNNLLTAINNRLTVLLDKDHTIGHAWLWSVKNINDLRNIFKIKILPLLQEFFYNDYEKIGLVLGDGFVGSETVSESVFASFKNGTGQSAEYNDSTLFFLKDIDERTIKDFQALYNN